MAVCGYVRLACRFPREDRVCKEMEASETATAFFSAVRITPPGPLIALMESSENYTMLLLLLGNSITHSAVTKMTADGRRGR
jgi:hypothetical protein